MPAPVGYSLDDGGSGRTEEAACSYFLPKGSSFCAIAVPRSSWSVARRVSCPVWWHLGDFRVALLTPHRGAGCREQGLQGWERMGRSLEGSWAPAGGRWADRESVIPEAGMCHGCQPPPQWMSMYIHSLQNSPMSTRVAGCL